MGNNKNDPDDENGPTWPVTKASELTIDHVPRKLRDEITRPIRADGERVAQLAILAINYRDDLHNALKSALRGADKDGGNLAARVGDPRVQAAFKRFGLLNDAPQPQGGGGNGE